MVSSASHAGTPVQMTHFSPEANKAMLAHTAQSLPLIMNLFETLLGSRFPYSSLQQAFVPCGFSPHDSAGLQILPTSMLFTERCIEQVSPSSLATHYSFDFVFKGA